VQEKSCNKTHNMKSIQTTSICLFILCFFLLPLTAESTHFLNKDDSTQSSDLLLEIEMYDPFVQSSDCNECNGVIQVLHEQEIGQVYEYSIDQGLTYQSSNVFMDLCPGHYSLFVRNVNDITEFGVRVIDVLDLCILDANVSHMFCDECNGIIEILLEVEEGIEYEYSIDNGLTWQSSPLFEGLCLGDFIIKGRKVLFPNIEYVSSAQITYGPDLKMINFTYECNDNQNSANASMDIVGGTAGYYLSYIDPAGVSYGNFEGFSSVDFEMPNLIEGAYHFMVEDRLGCQIDSTIFILDDCVEPIEIYNPMITSAYCNECNGTITILHFEDEGYEYEYSVDGGVTWQLSNLFEGLCAANYILAVRDRFQAGTMSSSQAQIPVGVDIEIGNFTFDCNVDQNSAMASMEVNGGQGEYNVSYINPIGTAYDAGIGDDIIAFNMHYLVEGAYHFFVEDELGCQIDTLIIIEDDCANTYSGPGNELPDWEPSDWDGETSQFVEGELNIKVKRESLNDDIREKITLNIYAVSGQMIHQESISDQDSWERNVQMPSGVYFIVLQSASGKEEVFKRYIY